MRQSLTLLGLVVGVVSVAGFFGLLAGWLCIVNWNITKIERVDSEKFKC